MIGRGWTQTAKFRKCLIQILSAKRFRRHRANTTFVLLTKLTTAMQIVIKIGHQYFTLKETSGN